MDKYFKWKAILALAVIGFSIYFAYPPQEKIHLGLDLKGGMHILIKVETAKLEEKDRAGAVERAVEIIKNRIDQFGVREPMITKQGKDEIVVQLPGMTEQERAREIVSQTAHLEFKLVSDKEDVIKEALAGKVPEGYEVKEIKEDDQIADTIVLETEPIMAGDKLTNASVGFDSYGQAVVEFQLDKDGAKILDAATFKNIGRKLAIILDGKVHSAPVIRDRIPNGRGQISGSFTVQQASDLALVLRAGALPAPVTIVEERTVGPTLGQDSIRNGIYASIGGAALVVLFMVFYYLVPGIISGIAVVLNLVILFGVMAKAGASLTLPGIAGLILTMGMAVDANVLINERMREEMKLGKAIRSVIAAGYHKAFSAILDSNVTTILSAMVLLYFGSGPVRGFAITLTIGLIASMFTSLFITRLIFDYFTRDRKQVSLKMVNLFPGQLKIDWMKLSKMALIISAIMVIVSGVAIATKAKARLGIDFTGGTVEEIHLNQTIDLGKIRSALSKAGLDNASLQNYGPAKDNNILIRTKEESKAAIQKALEGLLGKDKFVLRRSEYLGPAAGSEMLTKAFRVVMVSLLAILAYVWWRFNFTYAVCAVIALAHDSLIGLGAFVFVC